MRHDTIVSLFKDSNGKCNPRTHKHNTEPILIDSLFANVASLGLRSQVQLLGGTKQGSKTIRFKEEVVSDWNCLIVDEDDRKYRFISSLNIQKGYAAIVDEDVS